MSEFTFGCFVGAFIGVLFTCCLVGVAMFVSGGQIERIGDDGP